LSFLLDIQIFWSKIADFELFNFFNEKNKDFLE